MAQNPKISTLLTPPLAVHIMNKTTKKYKILQSEFSLENVIAFARKIADSFFSLMWVNFLFFYIQVSSSSLSDFRVPHTQVFKGTLMQI